MERPMAKKRTVDKTARTAARRNRRRASQSTAKNPPAAPAAAAEIGDPAKDASAGEALPITGSPALKTGRQPEKPNDAGGVSAQTSGSSDRNPGTPQTSPEKSPQVPWARHCSETPLRSTKRTDRDGALIRADMPARERSNSGEGDVRWIELHGGPCGYTTIEQATDN